MSTTIVLAMHGTPPNDFPRQEMSEWFALHGRMEHARGPERAALEQRYNDLEARMRSWPRTVANDPFHASSLELAALLRQVTGLPVIVGFNEFCAPSLVEALEEAVRSGAEKVVVVTPMMTRGGEHAEQDIPAAIEQVQSEHAGVHIAYAWPFEPSEVAGFLAQRVRQEMAGAGLPASTADPGQVHHSMASRRQ